MGHAYVIPSQTPWSRLDQAVKLGEGRDKQVLGFSIMATERLSPGWYYQQVLELEEKKKQTLIIVFFYGSKNGIFHTDTQQYPREWQSEYREGLNYTGDAVVRNFLVSRLYIVTLFI